MKSYNDSYFYLKLPKDLAKLESCSTVGELAEKGCPICKLSLNAEASPGGFGSLWCNEHKEIWIFGITIKQRECNYKTGTASRYWKNFITGAKSKVYKEKY